MIFYEKLIILCHKACVFVNSFTKFVSALDQKSIRKSQQNLTLSCFIMRLREE